MLIVISISLIVIAFTFKQVEQERQRLTTDLQYRTTLLGETFKETIEPYYVGNSPENIKRFADRFTDKERLKGLIIYDNKDKIIASSSSS